MKGFRFVYVFGILIILALVLVGLMQAQEPETGPEVLAAEPLGSPFTYQGPLSTGSELVTERFESISVRLWKPSIFCRSKRGVAGT